MKTSPSAGSPVGKPTIKILAIVAAIALLGAAAAPLAQAQFHVREGDKVVQRQVIPTTATAASASATAASGQRNYAAAVSPTGRAINGMAADTGPRYRTTTGGISDIGWDYNQMIDDRNEIVWGRAIHHPNGNYTVSKIQDSTLVQRTYSQPKSTQEHAKTDDERQPVERRVVQLDANNRPVEVLIYDIRNQLKFRGLLIYGPNGYFREERLLNPGGQIVRRRVQEYDRGGNPLPVETFMDETGLATDITLVLTGKESPGTTAATGGTGASATAAAPPEKKKSLLRRAGSALLFWKK